MKREDFKKIKEEHFKICEKLIEKKGACYGIDFIIHCDECPFSEANSFKNIGCYEGGYVRKTHKKERDEVLVANAKEFLKFRPSKLTIVKINEEELEKFKNQEVRLATFGDKEGIFKKQDVVMEPVSDYKKAKHDAVNSPVHYQLEVNGEIIQVKHIANAVVKDMKGQKAAYVWNVVKYILRAEKKNGIEDYKKARKYLDFIIGEIGE